MKRKMSLLINLVTVSIIAASIVVLPNVIFRIQERQLMNIKMEVPIEAIEINKNDAGQLDINSRLEMIQADNMNIEKLTLKTGDKYSLYEARKQCNKELRKILILEMDLYGPIIKEIKVEPFMIIDSVTPAYSFIIWQGIIVINKITYNIILDEESGKIIQIKVVDSNDTHFQAKINEALEKYLYEN